jgi:signal transduction histidine kinase
VGLHGTPYYLTYGCTKAAVAYFVEAAAAELGEHGIRVNGIAPRAEYSVAYELVGLDGALRRMHSFGRCVPGASPSEVRLICIELEVQDCQFGGQRDDLRPALPDHLEVPIACIDRNLKYRYLNPAYVALHSSDDNVPQLDQPVLASIADPTRLRRVADALTRVLKGEASVVETEFVDERGEVSQWIDFHFKPVRDASGAIDGAIAVGYDVSPLRRANQYHKTLSAELRQRLRHRAAHIDAANRDLSNRVASACDEVRANLQQLRTLVGDSAAVANAAAAKQVAAALESMAASIDGLARLSGIGLRRPDRRKIDMNRLLREVVRDFGFMLEGRTVDFEVGLLPHIVADRTLVKQVLQSLIGNAIKFTRGRPSARIRVWTAVEDGVTVWSVADNGVGFDPKDADEMFGAFVRHGMKPPGMGLSIAWRAIQQLNGRLWCESRPGSGAIFHFTIEDHESRPDLQHG